MNQGTATQDAGITNVGEVLVEAAAAHGDRTALITPTRSMSFAELDDLSSRVASALRSRGIGRGDRVSILATNRWEWIVAYHGALRTGAVVNPINAMLTPTEVRFVLEDCGSSALFASGDRLAALADVLGEVESLQIVIDLDGGGTATGFEELISAEETRSEVVVVDAQAPSTIGYTSGTTGHPKGAVQSHEAVLLNCLAAAAMHGRGEDDVVVTALPAPHVYGNVVINSTFMAGGTVVLMERFDPAVALDLISQHRATMFEGVPAMYSMLMNEATFESADLSSITRSTVGGQTIAPATVAAWEAKTGAPLIELWGMTELAGLGTTHWHDEPIVRGSIGVALPGLELRVADFDDHRVEVATGQPGELMARGPHVLLEYFGNEKATAETVEADGWLHTGDVATVNESGHYFIVDRRKDMILTAGYNVYPAEIERVVAAHPAVAMVAVGAVPDDVKGELARAYVVLREGAEVTSEEIIAFARQELAPYKVPRSVQFVETLPQTSSGKIMRRKLAELAED